MSQPAVEIANSEGEEEVKFFHHRGHREHGVSFGFVILSLTTPVRVKHF